MKNEIPLESQFGADVGARSGRELLQKTLTTFGYQAMPKAIAGDFNGMFSQITFSNGRIVDPMLLSRLQGYLSELSMAVGLMTAVLQESGFEIKSTFASGGDKLSIQKKGASNV